MAQFNNIERKRNNPIKPVTPNKFENPLSGEPAEIILKSYSKKYVLIKPKPKNGLKSTTLYKMFINSLVL
ncbi:hypothetical protein EON78_04140 [bacterium]|nr:MAG: hypothetical protein EON78_04140 [bacterium]